MMAPLILVVDDEAAIHRFLTPSLKAEGYRVIEAADGAAALRKVEQDRPDLIVLDLGLPDMDGKTVIRTLRRDCTIPIIVLSARDREAEKVLALDLGADDFVNKPFGVGELMARIRAALRHRVLTARDTVFTAGDIVIDTAAHWVQRKGVDVKLTRREFALLELLFRNAGKVVTHRQLLHDIWGPANEKDTQYLRVYIGHLRAKLEEDPAAPRLVLTEPGIGYRLAGARHDAAT
ncbi:response regulator [Aureimonas frigidaquae]|uniref:Two component transcriptional regulator n=1 Tax=Aureimonas frigidaquae TaxID=424757 RepID=A0A0P0Z4C4_9HYPH|nr:response regulator [Aureimonas frigidaquae]BAT29000.1 two component transcriptional regulator [Aureimonas frigidaquae]